MSYLPSHKPYAEAATACEGVSSGECVGAAAGKMFRRVFDPYHKRQAFPDQWAQWCRENFRNSTQLGAAFGVDERTARNWMGGVSAPMGWAVDAAKEGEIEGVPPFRSRSAA